VIDQDEQIVKQRLDFVIRAIARQLFSDADKARKDMEAFAAANEQRLYKLFKACADPQTDLRTLVKSRVGLDCCAVRSQAKEDRTSSFAGSSSLTPTSSRPSRP